MDRAQRKRRFASRWSEWPDLRVWCLISGSDLLGLKPQAAAGSYG